MLVVVLLNLLLFAILYIIFSRRIHKSLDTTEIMDSIRNELQHLVVELNQTTDRNVRLAEERIQRLKGLLNETDKKLQILSRESDKHNVGIKVYDQLKRSAASTIRTPPDMQARETEQYTRSGEVLRMHRQGFSAKVIASKVDATLGEVELIISLENTNG